MCKENSLTMFVIIYFLNRYTVTLAQLRVFSSAFMCQLFGKFEYEVEDDREKST